MTERLTHPRFIRLRLLSAARGDCWQNADARPEYSIDWIALRTGDRLRRMERLPLPSGRWASLAARVVPVPLLIVSAIAAWYLVYDMIVVRDVGSNPNFWAGERLLAYAVFILAPTLTFVPIGRALRIPLYDLEAIAAWSTLCFTVTFISPGSIRPLPVLLLFAVTLTMVATIFTLISYAVDLWLLTRRSQRYDFVRALGRLPRGDLRGGLRPARGPVAADGGQCGRARANRHYAGGPASLLDGLACEKTG